MKQEEIETAQEAIALLKQFNRLEIAMSHLKKAEQLAYRDVTIYNLLQPVKKYLNEEIKKCIEESSALK
tara:strand:- start:566 stop:772 length:207 start_codon:yes stop_codon:yes gene_type:complete